MPCTHARKFVIDGIITQININAPRVDLTNKCLRRLIEQRLRNDQLALAHNASGINICLAGSSIVEIGIRCDITRIRLGESGHKIAA